MFESNTFSVTIKLVKLRCSEQEHIKHTIILYVHIASDICYIPISQLFSIPYVNMKCKIYI
jgi:hypothetical protein